MVLNVLKSVHKCHQDLSVKIATLTQECLNYRRKIDYEDIELKTAKVGGTSDLINGGGWWLERVGRRG